MTKVAITELKRKIDMTKFSSMFTPDVKKVIHAIEKYGFEVRIVGGAVRDFMLGEVPRDVDLATDAEPAEIIYIFEQENIEYDTHGIVHGTVKAVFGKTKVDLSSIVYRLRQQDSKLKIERVHSWEEDSKRRDITINSMSVDLDGNLHDYQNALKDLDRQLVKFCPDIEDRIIQAPIHILRWIKAIAHLPYPRWLKKDQDLVTRHVKRLSEIKDDKKTQLLLAELLRSKHKKQVFKLMCKLGIAQELDLNCM